MMILVFNRQPNQDIPVRWSKWSVSGGSFRMVVGRGLSGLFRGCQWIKVDPVAVTQIALGLLSLEGISTHYGFRICTLFCGGDGYREYHARLTRSDFAGCQPQPQRRLLHRQPRWYRHHAYLPDSSRPRRRRVSGDCVALVG